MLFVLEGAIISTFRGSLPYKYPSTYSLEQKLIESMQKWHEQSVPNKY